MKKSIARQVTRKVSVILIVALAILFIASFFLVQYTVYVKTRSYAKAIVTVFTDLVVNDSYKSNTAIDEEHADMILSRGDYVCKWYKIDFAYLFIPDLKTGKIRYLCVSQNEKFNKINPDDKYVGKVTEYKLTNDEVAVWKGKKLFSHSITKSKTGHELSTMLKIEDVHGNKIMAGVDQSYEELNKQIINIFSILALIIILVILGIDYSVYLIIKKRVSSPAQRISQSMNKFITDGKRTSVRLNENGSDEYAMISSAFNSMTDNINTYLNDIQALTKEKEYQSAELDIASRIQKGFLPKEYLNTNDFEVRSTMIPAKDVGGDFYYYLPLDKGRVLVVIADVSGKGISAALFMAVTLTLTVQYAKMNLPPEEILKKTNDTLSENNAALLFATEFIGIYDNNTKLFTYSNAGHNPPYIIKEHEIIPLDAASGMLLGLYENEKYEQATVKLNNGDTIFMYTDGVSEATNPKGQFFGIEKLETELKKFRESHAYNAISFINDILKDFAAGSEQHDDITMLTLTVKNTKELLLDFDIREFEKIKQEILSLPVSRSQQLRLCLCAEEWFSNICFYAFEGKAPENEKIRFMLTLSDRIFMRFEDGGQPFNPLEHIADPENYDIDTQIGGLGNFITVSNTDDVFYEYKNKKNIVTLVKFFEEEK